MPSVGKFEDKNADLNPSDNSPRGYRKKSPKIGEFVHKNVYLNLIDNAPRGYRKKYLVLGNLWKKTLIQTILITRHTVRDKFPWWRIRR